MRFFYLILTALLLMSLGLLGVASARADTHSSHASHQRRGSARQ